MQDTLILLAAADRLFASAEEAVLVTLIHTRGSTYRRPGARMLVLPGNRTIGTISGGCLESAVARQAWSLTRSTPRAAFTFESAPEDDTWGPASGCHGLLTLLAERIAPNQHHPALQQLAQVRATHIPAVLSHLIALQPDGTLFADQSVQELTPEQTARWQHEASIALANQASRWVEQFVVQASCLPLNPASVVQASCLPSATTAAFLEYLAPPTHLVLCGAGDDAQPVARLAAELAWTVDILDTRARLATRDRFPTANSITASTAENLRALVHPHTHIILMTHRFADDVEILAQLFQQRTALNYIGILGPRRRTERLLAELAARNIVPTARQLHSIRSPIGLDLGATNPETIALSIIAEIQATSAARDAHPLSTRTGPLAPPNQSTPAASGSVGTHPSSRNSR